MIKLLLACLPKYLNFLLFSFVLLSTGHLQAQGGGCECTNCPQFMPDLFIGSFPITVQNASNPTLGQNGQGVCGVIVHFNHTAICDITITLTSPSGQTVTLVGPIGQFCTSGGNAGTDWNVLFLPCGDPSVAPDPGFTPTWNNNQPWGGGNSYSGSYYPFSGCLQNFTGPVNGTWTLTVVDGQANDVGNLLDYEIIFCDPSGINCFNCEADAGNLPQNDVVECEGSSNLNLNLPPAYTPPAVMPPASEYSYAYVISGPGGVILAIDPSPDLSSYPPGTYTVCGLSYLTAASGTIPSPNGSLTVNQLRTQLNSNTPPFCGDISVNCVGVTIKVLPDDVEEFAEICAPQCYQFFGQFYCQSGTFVRNLIQNGCPYTGTLNLTVHQPNTVFINETICPGSCSTNPLFPTACTAGLYQETAQNVFGCDSFVNLTLTVMNLNANIQTPPVLSCGQTSAPLFGAGSTIGVGVSYLWSASNGGTITGSTTSLNTTIGSAGDYGLRVCRTLAGVTCCDTAMVTVTANNATPPAPGPITGSPTICLGQNGTYTVAAVTGANGYTWTTPAGVTINSGQNTASINVSWNSLTPGNICVTANNACGPSPQTCLLVAADTIAVPVQPIGDATVCAGITETYNIPSLPGVTAYVWTVPLPATIASGQGTNQISVNWGAAPGGSVCVSATGACGTSPQQCLPVLVTNPPTTPAISGNPVVCAGNPETYTATAIPGATTYTWQITGGMIISGNGTSSVQAVWDSSGIIIGTLCVSAGNACGTSPQTCIGVSINPPLPLPLVTGSDTLCTGTSGSYSIASITGATGYTWTVPASGMIVSGQNTTAITVDWSAAPGGNVCVSAISSCGAGPQQCLAVTVYTQPTANAGVDSSLCGTVFILNADPSVSGSTGAWSTLTGPGTVSFVNATVDSTQATASQNGAYLFGWTENNGGCTDVDTVQVDFNASPQAGQIIPDCDATNQNYTIEFQITGSASPFGIPGGVVTGNGFISDPVPSGQSFSFVIADENGCVSTPITGSFNCNCSTAAGQMSLQTLSTCEGGLVTAIHQSGENLDGNDTVGYVLHTNAGPLLGTVFAQNSSGTFGFQTGMSYGVTYYVSFVVGDNLNGFPDLADPCLSVAQGQPVVFNQNPVADAGLDQAACGLTMSVTGNAGTGTWTVSNVPAGGTLNIGTPQSTVTNITANVYGVYALTWTLDNSGCTGSDDVLVTFNDAPLGGTVTKTCDGVNENYQVSIPISGGLSPYTVNGTPVAGNSFLSALIPDGVPYNFTITDANGCVSAPISGTHICNCTTDAGVMNTQVLTVCGADGASVQFQTAASLDANDTTAYVLHTGAGAALGTVLAQNHTGIFTFQAGMSYGVTYYISLVAGDDLNGLPDPADPCFSVASGQPVVFLQNPAPNAGPNTAVCGQTIVLPGITSAFSGVWTQQSGPATATIATPNAAGSSVSVPVFGVYSFAWTETNGICVRTDSVQITFNETPAVNALTAACNPTNTQYTVTFDVLGGSAPYTVNGLGGTFSGNTFSSAPLTDNNPYSFVLVDVNGCQTATISGNQDCFCVTNAGTMITTPAVFCADTPASATWNNNPVFDGDDIGQFILHSLPGNPVGTVFATNMLPTFNFTGGLQTGVTYYISAIAGNALGTAVDLNDPCLNVAPGTPVQWKPLPNATLAGNASICAGDATPVTFSGTGVYPLQITYNNGTGNTTLSIPSQQAVNLNISPTANTTFTLVSVSDGTSPTCTTLLSNSVTINVSQPVTAGLAKEPLELCAGVAQSIQLGSLLNGADPGGQWSDVSLPPAPAGSFNAAAGTFQTNNVPAGTYRFRYLMDAQAPCPDDAQTVEVVIQALPVADAGADKALNCNQLAVTLGGPGTTGNAGYQWQLNGTTAGNTATLSTGTPGNYTLFVTTNAGCTASDAVTVTLDTELPFAPIISKIDVRCFGDRDGRISVDSIVSTHFPVLVALNDGPFSTATDFFPLPAGTYTIALQDANGCEWRSDSIFIMQPPKLTVELGPNLTVTLGTQAIVTATLSVPLTALDTLVWSPLLDSLHAGTLTQEFLPLQSRQIAINVVDSNGCTANDRVLVVVQKLRQVYIPNIIKPDSYFNNFLTVFGGPDVEQVENLRVFDRWGEQLFEALDFPADGQSVRWEGKFKGDEVAPGVYVYYATVRFIDGEVMVFKGDVTVLR